MLRELSQRLEAAGIRHVLIKECECGPPATAAFAGQATAIGVVPVDATAREHVRKLTSSLPLVSGQPSRPVGA